MHWTDTITGGLDAIEFHFANKKISDQNEAADCYYRLIFKPDLIEILKRIGRIPKPMVKDFVNEIKANADLEGEIKQLKEQ